MRRRIVCLALFAAPMVASCSGPPSRAERGAELYAYCAQCHGDQGEGKPEFRAPPIAGLELWYVQSQLMKFRLGARGDHPDDLDGLRMRPMARTLATEDEVAMVAQHVASLSPTAPARTLDGDPSRGATIYEPCVACHGADAAGNQLLSAPRLTGLADWYLVAQLQKFKDGVRGADRDDASGAQMRPNAVALDEQGMRDVAAYIGTLGE